MPIGQKEVTPEEGMNIANRVGLNSVNWNGSMLTLVLLDGSAVEIETELDQSVGVREKTPTFIHRTLRVKKTPTEKY